MIFVDTNYFIRFLMNDIPSQSEKVRKLFKHASAGKSKLISSTIVFFEIYWLFLKYYEKTKAETIDSLKGVLFMNFILFSERDLLQTALEIYSQTSLDLEDSYNIAYSRACGANEFASFDKKLQNYLKK